MNLHKILTCAVLAGSAVSLFSITDAQAASVSSAVSWAKKTAADDSHGYSQENRWGNPDYDCSSFVITAYKNAGFSVGNATYTGDMRSVFVAAGFKWIPKSSIDFDSTSDLKNGDILLSESDQHTEIYIGNGQRVGAHRDYDGGKAGDTTGKEISVASYYNGNWDGVLRYTASKSVSSSSSKSSSSKKITASSKYKSGVYKTTDRLNFRKSPSTSAKRIKTFKEGKVLYVVKTKEEWGKVANGSQTGWVSLDYCKQLTDPLTTEITLEKSSADESSITLNWSKKKYFTGYMLSYSTARNGSYKDVKVSKKKTSYKLKDLNKSTEYYFKVRAYRTLLGKTKNGKSSTLQAYTTTKNDPVKVKTKCVSRIRKYAGTSYKIRHTVKEGKKLTVLFKTKDKDNVKWYKVSYKVNGKKQSGYIMASLTKRVKR